TDIPRTPLFKSTCRGTPRFRTSVLNPFTLRNQPQMAATIITAVLHDSLGRLWKAWCHPRWLYGESSMSPIPEKFRGSGRIPPTVPAARGGRGRPIFSGKSSSILEATSAVPGYVPGFYRLTHCVGASQPNHHISLRSRQ